jgi:hypothetical protein
METKKSSIIKKSGCAGVVQSADPFPYENTVSHGGPMDNDVLAKMIKNIEKLSKSDHEEIYLCLRRHNQEGFFAVNCLGTHFNIDSLSDQLKWVLYGVINMSLTNTKRLETLQSATTEHTNVMMQAYSDKPASIECEIRNPSETDKTNSMLLLNKNKFNVGSNIVVR